MEIKCPIWEIDNPTVYGFNPKNLSPIALKRAQGIVLFYDATNYDSFSHLNDWFDLILKVLPEMELHEILLLGSATRCHAS